MARTRRSRQAAAEDAVPAPAASTARSNNDNQLPTRARTRASRSRNSLAQRDVSADTEVAAARANDSGSSIEIGRRALETPSQRRDTTGLDLLDDSMMFGDLGDSFADGDVPAAPRSADTTRSWSNFKTRSRQSSIIGRNDPPIRPSSRGGNTPGISSSFNIGVFRRRAREPSILGSRKPRSETSGRDAQSDLESENEFAPEAESTPLNNRRRTRASLAAQQQESSRDVSAATGRSRKRKSGDELSSGRAAKSTRTEADEGEGSASESDLSELASPQLGASALPRPVTPVGMDEINAPPASSASEDEGNAWPDIHSLAKRRRRPSVSTPLREDNLSDISSPPSLTHSPNYADKRSGRSRGRAAAKSHELAAMTSADLANLLPKRRYRKTREDGEETDPGEEADDDDDEEEEEEDGPSHPRTRSRSTRRGGSRTPSRAASRATPTSGRQRGNNALAPRQTPVSKRRTRSATSKTYSRRSSDKENQSDDEADDSQFQPLDDETFDATSAIDFQSVDELKTATKKFMEVDKWELEYEEVAESFSPKGAR